jgi:hypothetical protein
MVEAEALLFAAETRGIAPYARDPDREAPLYRKDCIELAIFVSYAEAAAQRQPICHP